MYCMTHLGATRVEVTTEHATSNHGLPVVLVDGTVTDTPAEYRPDPCGCTALDLLADAAGIHDGPETRRELHELAAVMLPENPRGADYDAVLDEFRTRGMTDAT